RPTDHPAMVTIASCNGAEIAEFKQAGASLAHELHVQGVPVVIASQFPLSKSGSVLMVSEIYRRVLHGEDVRVALHLTRRRLFNHATKHHDWASLVAYVSLPDDIDGQFDELTDKVRRKRVEHGLQKLDQRISPDYHSEAMHVPFAPDLEEISSLTSQLEKPLEELKLVDQEKQTSRTAGVLASTYKRLSQMRFAAILNVNEGTRGDEETSRPSREAIEHQQSLGLMDLMQSRDYYLTAMKRDRAGSWAYVQYLSLSAILHHEGMDSTPVALEHLDSARVLSSLTIAAGENGDDSTAHAALAELELLSWVIKGGDPGQANRCAQRIVKHLERFLSAVEPGDFEVYATWRQFQRYRVWFSRPLNPDRGGDRAFYPNTDPVNPATEAMNALPIAYLGDHVRGVPAG
ncbi:MAG: CHAT domain-containing protein, partial [Planctomycetota bacterium]